MIEVPGRLWVKYERCPTTDGVAENERRAYRKWLLFCLDCA